jgi:dUTP pyrophosphatase
MAQRKRFYAQGEKVFIKTLKKTGIVQSLDIPNLQAEISYIASREGDNVVIQKATFKFEDIDKLREKEDKKDSKRLTILVRYLDSELPKLEKLKVGSWIDLRSAVDVEMKAGEHMYIPLGVCMSLPFGYEGHVLPRSSTYKNFGITMANSEGIIDNVYRGNTDEWKFSAIAHRDTVIKKGDRICQFRIEEEMPDVNIVEVDELKSPDRGGFGSTGTK